MFFTCVVIVVFVTNEIKEKKKTYELKHGRHLARLHRRRRRGHAYAPTNNTASHDNHEKIH